MALSEFSDFLKTKTVQDLPHEGKVEIVKKYWQKAAAEEPRETLPESSLKLAPGQQPDPPSYHDQQYNDSLRLLDAKEKLKTASPIQARFLQQELVDSSTALAVRQSIKSGKMTEEEGVAFAQQKSAERASETEALKALSAQADLDERESAKRQTLTSQLQSNTGTKEIAGANVGIYEKSKDYFNDIVNTSSGMSEALAASGGDIQKAITYVAGKQEAASKRIERQSLKNEAGVLSPAIEATKYGKDTVDKLVALGETLDAAGIPDEERPTLIKDVALSNAWTSESKDRLRKLSTGELAINPGSVFGDKQGLIDEINKSDTSQASKELALEKLDRMRENMSGKLFKAAVYSDTSFEKALHIDSGFEKFAGAAMKEGTSKPEILDEWSKQQKDRGWVYKFGDAIKEGTQTGAAGIGKTLAGTGAGVASLWGGGEELAARQQELQQGIEMSGQAADLRGLNEKGLGVTRELTGTVTQMAPMMAGGILSFGGKGALAVATRAGATYGWAGIQGMESKLQDAVELKQQKIGRELTPVEITETYREPKVQIAALANGIQTVALTKLLAGTGMSRASLGIQSESLTVADFLTRGGQKLWKSKVFKDEIRALGKTAGKDFTGEAFEESVNQVLDKAISVGVLGETMKLGNLIEETFKAGALGGIAGGALPQFTQVTQPTHTQTTDELEATANRIATQENLPETQDTGGTIAAPSDAGVAPAVQMSRSEFEAAVIERRAELTDSEEDQAEVAELDRPLEEIAVERNVELTENDEQDQEIPEEIPLQLPPVPTGTEAPTNLEPPSSDQETVAPAEAEVQGEVAAVIPEDNGAPRARAVVSNFLTPEARALPPEDFQQQKTASPEQVTLQNSVAKMYDELPEDDSSNPEVVQAYENLATEVLEQHKAMLNSGLKIELVSESPYKSSKEMVEDVNQGRLKIQRTDSQTYGEFPGAFNAGKHLMLRDSGLKDVNGQPLLVNDIFRGVHDYIAHAAFGSTFGPLGEEAAWKAHLATSKDPLARRALTTETRGQNSWVNYRDEMLRDGMPIKKGEPGYVAPQDRPFATQKFALLPEEALREIPKQNEQNTQPQVSVPAVPGNGLPRDTASEGTAATPTIPTNTGETSKPVVSEPGEKSLPKIKGPWKKSYSPQQTVELFTQGITPLDGRKVDAIKKHIAEGGSLPEITLDDEGYVRDGMHRTAAYTELAAERGIQLVEDQKEDIPTEDPARAAAAAIAPDKPEPAPKPKNVAKKPAPKLPPKIQESPKTTSVKNAETDKELEDAGFAPVYAPARVALQESLDKALQEVNDDPNKDKENSIGKNLVEELHQKPRTVSDVEHGILIDELAKAKVRASRAEKSMFEAAKLNDFVKLATAQNELSAARNEIARVAMASKLTGTELGRSFRFRQIRIEEDYSIEAMAARFQADINDGKPLNAGQEKMIRKLQKELAASEEARVAAEDALAAEVAAKEQLQQENLQLKVKKPRKAPERRPMNERLRDNALSAREKLVRFSAAVNKFSEKNLGKKTIDPDSKSDTVDADENQVTPSEWRRFVESLRDSDPRTADSLRLAGPELHPVDGRASAGEVRAARSLAKLFGRRVVIVDSDFEGNAPPFGGFTTSAVPGVVFIHAKSSRPLFLTTGHELWHHFTIDRPALAAELRAKLPELIRKDVLSANYPGYTSEEHTDEVMGDVLSEAFADAGFWKKLQERDSGLFARTAAAVSSWLKGALDKLRGAFRGSQHFQELEKAQSMLADVMAEWAKNPKATADEKNVIKNYYSEKLEGDALSPDELKAFGDVGAEYLANGAKSEEDFTAKLVEEFPKAAPYAAKIYAAAQETLRKTAAGSRKKSPQELASLIDPDKGLSRQMVYNMTGGLLPKFRGDALINEVLRLIQPSLPNVTFNDVVDAYTGYGKAKFPSKEELATLQRKERRLQLLNRQIGVVREGQLPELTGLQQDRLDPNNEDDQKIRHMIAERNQLMKDLKLTKDSAKRNQMRGTLSAIKTRYRNDLAELQTAIDTRTTLVEKKKQNPQTDKELTELKAQKKAKRAEYNAAFGINTRQLSLEQRLKAADKALDKSLALEEKMELEGILKRPTKPGLPQTVAMKAKAARIKAKRDARHAETRRLAREAKELLNPPKTEGQRHTAALEKQVQRSIDRFEYFLKHGKLPPTEEEPTTFDRTTFPTELFKIKAELAAAVAVLRADKRKLNALQKVKKNRAIIQLESLRDALEKQINNKSWDKPVTEKSSDPRVVSLKESIKILQSIKERTQKLDPNWVASYEAKLNDALIKASEARTAKWEQRLRDGDFSVVVKPSRVKTKELIEAMHRESEAKQAWNKLFFDSTMAKRTKLERARDIVLAPVDAIRTIKTIGDVSAPHRQGLLSSVAHPKLALRNYIKMWKAGRSSKNLTAITHEIEKNKYYVASQRGKTKLFLAKTGPGASLADLEEAFRGRLVDHIPLASQVKGFSERTYNGFLNGMRMDHFAAIADSVSGGDPNNLTNEQISEIANYVNISTGRGNLGQHETAAGLLALAFFSPKFLTSRFQWLTGALLALPDVTLDAVFRIRTPEMRKVRQAIALEQARSIVGLAALYSLYVFGQMMYGDDEEDELKEILSFNPLTSKGGRIKMGDTYVDPAGGLAQTVNFLARTIVNKTVTGSGEERDLGDAKFGQQDFGGLLWQFTRTKLAPVPGSIINVRSGRNVVGQKATLRSEAIGSVLPMIINDSYETLRANGMAQGVPLAVLAAHGVGLSTRDNKPSLAQQAAILVGDDPSLFEKGSGKKSSVKKFKIKPLNKQ